MANVYEETVEDFDLNFLQPLPSIHNVNVPRIDKQRQSIINVKNKIIASHRLLQKFYLQRDKLDETESLLLASKEECKQACLDYKATLEKCIQMEKDVLKFKKVNQELEQKLNHLDSQCEAMRSHAHQLQLLVKEHESVIEALNIEKQLERNTVKDCEKKLASLEKERETYIRDIQWMRDVILGKKKSKSCKDIINKYKNLKGSEDNTESDNSGDENYFDDSPLGSPINDRLQNKEEVIFGDKIIKGAKYESGTNNTITAKQINENDFDCCNEEVVSEDTGRGSSLAFSDADKFFNSPEVGYGTEGHQNVGNKEIIIHVDVGTSPIRIEENLMSSPNIFDDEALLNENITDDTRAKSPEYFITDIPLSTEIVTIKEKKQLLDASTSPIHHFTDMVHTSTSPIAFEIVTVPLDCPKADTLKSKIKPAIIISNDLPEKDSTVPCHRNIETLSGGNELEISTESLERNCLDQNNSKKLCNETNNDCEVEMILSNMRFEHALITPIPRTPAISQKPDRIASNALCKQTDIQQHTGCPDALKIREENKALQANITFLCKEIMLIKNILKTKVPENAENVQSFNNKDSNLFDDNSQETIVLTNDGFLTDDCSNVSMSRCHNSDINLDTQSDPSQLVENDAICIDDNEQITQLHSHQKVRNMDLENERIDHDNVEVIETSYYINSKKEDNSQSTFTDILFDNSIVTNNQLSNSNDSCTINNIQPHKGNEDDTTQNIEKPRDFEDYISAYDDLETSTAYGLRFTNNYQAENSCRSVMKTRKPTKLDRFKKKILPKCKISRVNNPTMRKLRRRTRLLPITNKEQRTKSIEIFNNKEAYDKAIKVMAEIKSKSKVEIKKGFRKPNSKLDKMPIRRSPRESITKNNNRNEICKSQKDESKLARISSLKESNTNLPSTPDKITLPSTLDKITLPPTLDKITLPSSQADSFIHDCNNLSDSDKGNFKSLKDKNIVTENKGANNSVQTIATRSRYRNADVDAENSSKKDKSQCDNNDAADREAQKPNRRRKRNDSNNSDVSCKRMLRSSCSEKTEAKQLVQDLTPQSKKVAIDYNDLDIFTANTEMIVEKENFDTSEANMEKGNEDINKVDKNESNTETSTKDIRRRSKRLCSNNSDINSKRSLRSSNLEINDNHVNRTEVDEAHKTHYLNQQDSDMGYEQENHVANSIGRTDDIIYNKSNKGDNNVFVEQTNVINKARGTNDLSNSILCKMIVKHGRTVLKYTSSKVSDTIANTICKQIENSIVHILEEPPDKTQSAITDFVEEMRKISKKSLLAGLMKYLQDPTRKLELYNKVNCHVSFSMTKTEQIILSVLQRINTPEYNIVNDLLSYIEFALFRLNNSPEFDTIESLSHFYAATCRLFHMKYRLKTFLLDAMYCLQYKSVILIKQCLTTWTHILPLAHMKYAKTPLITCIVYLLHFYKCEDRFNRVKDLRWILNKKYFYTFSEWNETKILEMFSNAIKSVKEDPAERNMLRIALLIFAKRHGTKWCQRNVINSMLLPMIEGENTAETVKIFCIKMLGPLLKPYPGDMKVHCEIIVNQLLDMFDQKNLSHGVKEAILTSLIYMSKHNPLRVTKALLSWQPENISAELENLLKAYVREKPIKAWKTILSKTYV